MNLFVLYLNSQSLTQLLTQGCNCLFGFVALYQHFGKLQNTCFFHIFWHFFTCAVLNYLLSIYHIKKLELFYFQDFLQFVCLFVYLYAHLFVLQCLIFYLSVSLFPYLSITSLPWTVCPFLQHICSNSFGTHLTLK